MIDLGIVKPGSTIYIPFGSYAASTGAPSAMTGLATSDIQVYKDGSTTQRASASGFTLLDTDGLDFDGLTGINGISIDLADNTTAGFWAAGSRYWVVISDVTVDSQTVRFPPATFTVGLPAAVLNTTIATLATQTSFTLTSGPAEDDALNGCILYLHDVASAVQGGFAVISDYTGSTKTVTLAAATTYTAAATDNAMVLPPALLPTTRGRTLDVDTNGRTMIQGGLRKNAALNKFTFPMTDTTNHEPTAGFTVSGTVRIDGGTAASLTDSVTGLGNGWYEVDISASEMNGNVIALLFTATGADPLPVTLLTYT